VSDPVSALLADIVHETAFGNPWHSLAAATEGLSDADLAYKPVPGIGSDWGEDDSPPRVLTPRHIFYHLAWAAEAYGNGLAARTADATEDTWDALHPWRRSKSARRLVKIAQTALERLCARARGVHDVDLLAPSGIWDDFVGDGSSAYMGFVLMDGGVLHTAWHLGQLAMLIGWRALQQTHPLTVPEGLAGPQAPYPGNRNWADLHLASRTETCVRLLEAAHRESPFHSICRVLEGASPEELRWSAFPHRWGPLIAIRVAHCKVIYADQAFGEGTLTWGECDSLLGTTWTVPTWERAVAAMDRAHEFLVERVARATDADLSRLNPMHHKVPMTGWQVVASMAQHDAWHAGQIAIMRDVCRALS